MHPSRECWAWQWFNWRWPFQHHQWTTQTIWRPGTARFRDRAWQPDISGWTTFRFNFDTRKWAHDRGVTPSQVSFDMNTGSVARWTS